MQPLQVLCDGHATVVSTDTTRASAFRSPARGVTQRKLLWDSQVVDVHLVVPMRAVTAIGALSGCMMPCTSLSPKLNPSIVMGVPPRVGPVLGAARAMPGTSFIIGICTDTSSMGASDWSASSTTWKLRFATYTPAGASP